MDLHRDSSKIRLPRQVIFAGLLQSAEKVRVKSQVYTLATAPSL